MLVAVVGFLQEVRLLLVEVGTPKKLLHASHIGERLPVVRVLAAHRCDSVHLRPRALVHVVGYSAEGEQAGRGNDLGRHDGGRNSIFLKLDSFDTGWRTRKDTPT